MTPRTSHERKKENHARAKYVAAANRGWMSVKTLPPADQVKCFYLTSPFIEPAIGDYMEIEESVWASTKALGVIFHPPPEGAARKIERYGTGRLYPLTF